MGVPLNRGDEAITILVQRFDHALDSAVIVHRLARPGDAMRKRELGHDVG
jgi:hypothetical protein